MTEATPGTGWTLACAIRHLQGPQHLKILAAGFTAHQAGVRAHQAALRRDDHFLRFLAERRALLWCGIVVRADAGELAFRGFPAGAAETVAISPEFIRNAAPDFDRSCLEVAGGGRYGGVRVFLAADACAALAAPPSPAPPAVKHQYSADALAAWFTLRVHTWPAGAALPSEEKDRAAATAWFDSVPRGKFREIRGVKTPESWRKPGPRQGR
jgi:hypothetical protein